MFMIEYHSLFKQPHGTHWKRWLGPFATTNEAEQALKAETETWPNDKFRIVTCQN